MKIENNKLYAIIQTKPNGLIKDWFNWRVYLGRFVMLAYNQIKNKEDYKIYCISNLSEVANEN